jgi:hypothetical protein
VRREEPERSHALEHRLLDPADTPDLEEMVHDPDRVEADIVGLARDAGERRPDLGVPAGPRERVDLDADLHAARMLPGPRQFGGRHETSAERDTQ